MKSVIYVYLVMQFLGAESKSLYDALNPCHMSDPDFKTCYLNFLNRGIALVNNEIPGFKVPFTNPYKISSTNIDLNIENLGSANGTFKNIKVTNAFKVKINNIKYDLENLIFEYNLTHPKISAEAEFVLDGKLFSTSAHVEGSIKGKLTLVNSNIRLKYKIVERRGIKYFAVDDFKLQMYVGDAAVHIISNNPEEQPILDIIQNMFNQDARLYLDMLNPIYVERVETLVVRPLLDAALYIIPADKLLLK
ncbi:hypothetical protein ILUMI_04934 [Ignelater luminosus]|uniref:Uncharacterized protein n=1 Tax=Ignelater luminosus TaxID=2038154 RepID=A0A8K0DDV8_IGNLU|nr:hypothetical protein ILUMI_04934 [Ignelater luminosus]